VRPLRPPDTDTERAHPGQSHTADSKNAYTKSTCDRAAYHCRCPNINRRLLVLPRLTGMKSLDQCLQQAWEPYHTIGLPTLRNAIRPRLSSV
jgi:hypothetical protein